MSLPFHLGQLSSHHRLLRFLADEHAGRLLRVRHALQPFSFVFLLEGDEQFHIVLETLDTEEATYLWHLPKVVADLPLMLKEIDKHLNVIRKRGRRPVRLIFQVLLQSQVYDRVVLHLPI